MKLKWAPHHMWNDGHRDVARASFHTTITTVTVTSTLIFLLRRTYLIGTQFLKYYYIDLADVSVSERSGSAP